MHGELDAERVLELAARARAVVAGPGLGRAPATAALVDALVRGVEATLVLDADALYALAERLETLRDRVGPTALTPHAGELGRLLGRDSVGGGHRTAGERRRGGRTLGRGSAAEGARHARRRRPVSRCA